MPDGIGLFEREQVERARRYHRPLYLAAVVAIAVNLALLALLTFSLLGDRWYATTDGWPWYVRSLGFSGLVLTLSALVGLPIGFWAGYLEHTWSLSTQTAGGWLLDRLKALAINLLLGASALLASSPPPALGQQPGQWSLLLPRRSACLFSASSPR